MASAGPVMQNSVQVQGLKQQATLPRAGTGLESLKKDPSLNVLLPPEMVGYGYDALIMPPWRQFMGK